MSAGMPELGSKISLISKADIRYEGRLFTVDPQECTIALASVRSFGTEERETQFPVAPQNQVYDYILFRGSDIKDIRVVNNVSTLPNDPAIMQLSVPPSLGQQSYQPQSFSHPVLGAMGPQMGQYNTPYAGLGTIGGLPNSLAPGIGISRDLRNISKQQQSSELLSNVLSGPLPQPEITPSNDQGVRANENASVLDLIGGGSRSTTPVSLISRKSPTMDAGVQAGGGNQNANKDDKKTVQRAIQPPRNNQARERKESRGEHQDHRQNQNMRPQHQQRNQNQHHHQQQQQQHPHQHQHQHQHQSNRGGGGSGGGGGGGGGGGWSNRGGNNMRQRGRGRGTSGFAYRMSPNTAGGNQTNQKTKNTLKFDSEYDFEQANTEFEELRSQLAKVKISGTSTTGNSGGSVGVTASGNSASNTSTTATATATATTTTSTSTTSGGITGNNDGGGDGGDNENNKTTGSNAQTEVNGDSEKKDDSGNETGAGEGEHDDDNEVYYDKSKSFFDNISCEAIERSKGRSQRTDWRTERKLNSETFGVSATRRGGYRGRGGYYNRGGMYRGGYRGNNYRGQQNQGQRQQHTRQNHQANTNQQMQPVAAAAGK